jgi:hypothetical protein
MKWAPSCDVNGDPVPLDRLQESLLLCHAANVFAIIVVVGGQARLSTRCACADERLTFWRCPIDQWMFGHLGVVDTWWCRGFGFCEVRSGAPTPTPNDPP